MPKSYDGDFAKSPVGTGPFVLTAYETGVSATFKRNPVYWDAPKPYLDGVTFTFFNPNAVPAQEAALQTGAVDVYQSAPSTGSPLWHDPNIALPTLPSSYYGEFWFRTDTPPWTDARVRQAVAYALDRPAIISNIFSGRATVGNDEVFAPAFPGSPVLAQRSQDIAKAKQLLAAAGLGRGFSATLTTEGPGIFSQYATLVQSYVAQIGIDLSLNVESTSTFYGSGSNQPWLTVPVGIVDWAARATPEQLYQSAYTTGGIWNSSKWADPTFDKLANEYEATVDQASRAALAKQLATVQQEATPAVIAWWKDAVYSIWKKVHNLEPNGSYFLDLTATWLE